MAAQVCNCQSISVFGNTLDRGAYGFYFEVPNNNALILNNNFGGASLGSIGYHGARDSINTAQIFGNTLSEGISFHVQLTYSNSFGWFLRANTYLGSNSNSIAPFLDPASSAVHLCN